MIRLIRIIRLLVLAYGGDRRVALLPMPYAAAVNALETVIIILGMLGMIAVMFHQNGWCGGCLFLVLTTLLGIGHTYDVWLGGNVPQKKKDQK